MASAGYQIGIIGCGVAGQSAATFLAECGHDVTVFERFAEPWPLGAGLLLQPTGLAVLRALRLEQQALSRGGMVLGLEAKTAGGRSVLDLSYSLLHPAAHGLGIRRGVLFDLLHRRLNESPARLVTGTEIHQVVREHGKGVIVDKDEQRYGPYDLVVVADGAHSALRQRLMPEAHQQLYDWGCLWTTVPDSAGIGATSLLRQRVRGTRAMMGFLPVGDDQLTMYWSLPAAALAPDMPIDLGVIQRTGRALWPEAASIVSAAVEADDFSRATYRNVALPRWNDGPILFIGDAAHGTSPQLGQGANLALIDGWTLADVLGECGDIPSAIARFAERRGPTVRFYRQASHLLTPLFQSDVESLGWMRDAFMGIACRLPVSRTIAATTLAGLRISWLFSARLDSQGRYRLEA